MLSDTLITHVLAKKIGYSATVYEVTKTGGAGGETVVCAVENYPDHSCGLASCAGVWPMLSLPSLATEDPASLGEKETSDVASVVVGKLVADGVDGVVGWVGEVVRVT